MGATRAASCRTWTQIIAAARSVALALARSTSAAALLVTWPAVAHLALATSARPASPAHGGPSPGDHLQAGYNLWLPGDQLVNGRAPWRDPYQFQPEAPERVEPRRAGRSGSPSGRSRRSLGAVLGVEPARAPALRRRRRRGGAVAARARAAGGAGARRRSRLRDRAVPGRPEHGAPARPLVDPAARGAARLGAAAVRSGPRSRSPSIPLSGQLHLALGAVPFFVAYALFGATRPARRWMARPAQGRRPSRRRPLVRQATIEGSIAASGRSLAPVDR